MGLTREELGFLRTYMEEKAALVEGPAHLALKAAGIDYVDAADMFYKGNAREEFANMSLGASKPATGRRFKTSQLVFMPL
jgi:hypothetical protein